MVTNKPLFIVFEGLDGSGKSTQIHMLKEKLQSMGRNVHVTAEPTNSATGGLIRDALCACHKREPSELASLFLTDRVSHNVNPVWGIKKMLSEGKDVISDRYYYSSFAYQGIESDLQWIINMNLDCPQITKPDLCIYLDVDPDRCKNRIDTNRSHIEIYEKDVEIMRKIRNQFLNIFDKLKSSDNIRIVDANRTVEEISEEILQIITNLN